MQQFVSDSNTGLFLGQKMLQSFLKRRVRRSACQKGPEEVVCFCCRIDMISVALFEKGNWKISLGLVPLDCWKVLIGGFEIV